ncbi:putative membrane protein [Saccharothrix tamanrassetensis]|uniref:Putative membrane protein n=1 Tax=Saccharothrix tamanrassetensis TaxID=1051531 RepID=A0A841CLJ1_9PSEU|nr:hypothetical protein [Saccharothrix tamanrassetensis]MBB5958169.1 putative membrane protein [Saccharothrix tamanrassetensis]
MLWYHVLVEVDWVVLMGLVGLLVVGTAVLVAVLSLRRPVGAAMSALDRRLATGEIPLDEYERMRALLRAS